MIWNNPVFQKHTQKDPLNLFILLDLVDCTLFYYCYAIINLSVVIYKEYHNSDFSAIIKRIFKTSQVRFSEILLERRTDKAVILLKGTMVPVEEIASMLNYSNTSNFYKDFREYYQTGSREHLENSC